MKQAWAILLLAALTVAARAADLSVVLGRPTDRSITLSVLSATPLEVRLAYGPVEIAMAEKTEPRAVRAGAPLEFELTGLTPDTRYAYRLLARAAGAGEFSPIAEGDFHTQRAPGQTFVFDVQGDSHPERPLEHDPNLYARTLQGIAADRPDFFIALGDDFSVDTLRTVSSDTVTPRYALQRPSLSLAARSAPLFLVNGNHEQAAACNLDGTSNNVAVWAQNARNQYYPQPEPDGFYSGDPTPVPFIGPLRDYYAWTWGDALFVVIDPYWHSPGPVDNTLGGRGGPGKRDRWEITLGDTQYAWLKKTLESSRATCKFVFAHHILGGGRGGVEQATLFEWGGQNKRGDSEFARKRPGWDCPIHQLMAKTGVTIFFQGHDHLFARQELDGVVYQTVPEPANPRYGFPAWASDYTHGKTLPNSGRLKVTVSPAEVSVDYIRSWLPADETEGHKNGELAYHYSIPARPSDPFRTHVPPQSCSLLPTFTAGAEHAFRTRRQPGSPFCFTVTADSHLDANTDPAMYSNTLLAARAAQPAFHVDLGDTFMTEKRGDPERSRPQYAAQSNYFALVGAPVYLVPGNHDGESGPRAAEAERLRLLYCPQPAGPYLPGSRSDYFAWSRGDALFVALDPYRFAVRPPPGGDPEGWACSLGRVQYDWFTNTLAVSTARFKFVFIHHLAGGLENQGRGGAEAVPPAVHALLASNRVTAVFHGHDHFFARQERDGVVYQLVPQPGHPGESPVRQAAEYGYAGGIVKSGSGFIKVTVSGQEPAIEFVPSGSPGEGPFTEPAD